MEVLPLSFSFQLQFSLSGDFPKLGSLLPPSETCIMLKIRETMNLQIPVRLASICSTTDEHISVYYYNGVSVYFYNGKHYFYVCY